MKTALITGAGGYIGSELTEILLGAGWQVRAMDRWFFGKERVADLAAHANFRSMTQDIRNLSPADFEGIDVVFDLAALSNDPSGDLNPEWTTAINYEGRVHVARCAKQAGVRRYILASSCSVYGTTSGVELDERSPPQPLTTYAKANLAAEGEILPMSNGSFCASALRLATVFGLSRRMRFDLVVNLMTLSAVEKGRIFITGGGRQWRPLVHVKDCAEAFRTVAEVPVEKVAGEVFNVGTLNMQVLGIAYIVRENLPFPVDMQVAPDDPDKRDYNVSLAKLPQQLGWRPTRQPADAVQEIYEAMKAGRLAPEPWTQTVNWYKRLLEAQALMQKTMLQGRLL